MMVDAQQPAVHDDHPERGGLGGELLDDDIEFSALRAENDSLRAEVDALQQKGGTTNNVPVAVNVHVLLKSRCLHRRPTVLKRAGAKHST